MDDLLERQENEIIVLKSIYSNDFVDLRPLHTHPNDKQTNNNTNTNTTTTTTGANLVRITLYPQKSQSQDNREKYYVQVDLKLKITPLYPNEVPKITLENEKGLSKEQIKKLQRQLTQLANSMLGKEMIFELCQHIEYFLYENNKPPAKSFHDQWLESRLNMESGQTDLFDSEYFNDETNKCDEDLMAQIDFAVNEKRKMLHQERKKEKELEKRERLYSTNSPSNRTRRESIKYYSENESREKTTPKVNGSTPSVSRTSLDTTPACTPFKSFDIEFFQPQFLKVKCIELLRKIDEHSFSAYLGIETASFEMMNVYEWRISLEKDKIFDQKKLNDCEIEMNKFEEEFKKVSKLTSKRLLKYQAYKHFKEPSKNYYVIQICIEYIEGYTLDLFVNQKHTYSIRDNTLKMISIQLLDALSDLHANNIFHRDITLACIHAEKKTNTIRLSDFSLVKRLNDLNKVVTKDATNLTKTNMRTDLHQLGVVLLSLKLGEQMDYHCKIPSNIPSDMRNFISICIHENEPKQLVTFDCRSLRNHPFIQVVGVDLAKKTTPVDYEVDEEDDNEGCLSSFNDYPCKDDKSRLATEFEDIGFIGQGGFGEVLKARNKLDKCFYAIKRIRTNPNSKQYNRQIMREIKLLSRLNHENVVRYYSTWLERYVPDPETPPTPETNTKQEENKRKTQSQVAAGTTHNIPLRIRRDTENNEDPESSSESEDDDDNDFDNDDRRGMWSRKETSSFKDNSFGSDSISEFSSSPLSNDSIVSSNSSDNDDVIMPSLNHNNTALDQNHKNINFNLNDDETDESVIFAETSNEKIQDQNKTMEAHCTKKTKKNKQKKNQDDQDDSDDDQLEDEQNKKPSAALNQLDRQFIYIQMEYCGGRTLKYLIENGLYKSEEKLWCLLREILQGLNHIHEQGMIHRDLKPGNILIDQHGHAKIGDFGLATILQSDPLTAAAAAAPSAPGNPSNANSVNNSSNIVNTNTNSSNMFSQLSHSGNQNLTSTDNNNKYSLTNDSHHSLTLSGAVGTALYVAPELLVLSAKNKYVYTQKVDIYSLGIVFYEMCFPFTTKMERIHVIQNLRSSESPTGDGCTSTSLANTIVDYEKKMFLVQLMLNHDPAKRPSTKDLLHNELIPRKADEIAMEELLKSAFSNKTSSNYKKILKEMFHESTPNSKADEVAYDKENCKLPNSFQYLQIRENVYNTFTRIFQKYGGYLITYPLLMPWNELCNDFNKSFKLVDSSGMVVTLPFNHRLPFARYLARSGCHNLKRYFIGNVYQKNLMEGIKDHPKERIEASFDIVTSSHADCMPEIEILFIVNEIINSFTELATNHRFKLVCNHTHLLRAILIHCSITEQILTKQIYIILSEFTSKQNKSYFKDQDEKRQFLATKLMALNLSGRQIEKLLHFLLKSGDPVSVLSDLRSLHKSESHSSKLAKEGLNQLKIITSNSDIIDFKVPISVTTSFVLPIISHPYEYSGFIFQLLIEKKNREKKMEYHVLASCGRYDKLISYFKTHSRENGVNQCAIGISFDIQKIISFINEQAKQKFFRPELVICSIGSSTNSNSNTTSTVNENTSISVKTGKQKQQQSNQLEIIANNNNSQLHHEIKNRLSLFKQFQMLNRNLNTCTYLVHEKFATTDEMDEYCKKNFISSYCFLKETTSSQMTSQLFSSLSHSNLTDCSLSSSSSNDTINSSSHSNLIRIRSIIEKGIKFVEKKFNLHDFLVNSNTIINNMSTFNSIHSNSLNNSGFYFLNHTNFSTPTSQHSTNVPNTCQSSLSLSNNNNNNNFGSSSSLNSNISSQHTNSNTSNTYIDYLSAIISNSLFSPINSGSPLSNSSLILSNNSSNNNINNTNITNSNSLSSISGSVSGSGGGGCGGGNINSSNVMSQLNITLLTEPYSRQQPNIGSNRKKLEIQIATKISQAVSLFNARTRIELIAIDTPDNVIQTLANYLHLEMEEQCFNANWLLFLEKLENTRFKKQLCNFRLNELIRDLRYVKKSKVFVFYSLRSEQFKLLVAP